MLGHSCGGNGWIGHPDPFSGSHSREVLMSDCEEAGCSFCGATRKALQWLVAGPRLFICDQCALKALTALKGTEGGFAGVKDGSAQCSFCGKLRAEVASTIHLLATELRICSECLEICADIFAQKWAEHRNDTLQTKWEGLAKGARTFNKANRPKLWNRIVTALRRPIGL
jgi:hypothetical protein